MSNFLSKYKLEIAGLVVGAIAGYCYWYFVGCASGQCAITSKPLNSALYGAVSGALIFGLFKKNESKSNS